MFLEIFHLLNEALGAYMINAHQAESFQHYFFTRAAICIFNFAKYLLNYFTTFWLTSIELLNFLRTTSDMQRFWDIWKMMMLVLPKKLILRGFSKINIRFEIHLFFDSKNNFYDWNHKSFLNSIFSRIIIKGLLEIFCLCNVAGAYIIDWIPTKR